MAEATVSDKFAQVKGFRVEIDGAGGKEHDTAWESVSGGALIPGAVEAAIGGDQFHTHAPGHKSIEEITLRGAMTDKRAALCTWINETTSGGPGLRTVRITPEDLDGTVGPTYEYEDCFPVRYVFPAVQVLDPKDPRGDVELVEEVSFVFRRSRVLPPPPPR
jgi:hypothetical protein